MDRTGVFSSRGGPGEVVVEGPLPGLAEELDPEIRRQSEKAAEELDMFAGGGSIPLEALPRGCGAYALDLNPVAHIIELCRLVYLQKDGKPDPKARAMSGPKKEEKSTELLALGKDRTPSRPTNTSRKVKAFAFVVVSMTATGEGNPPRAAQQQR